MTVSFPARDTQVPSTGGLRNPRVVAWALLALAGVTLAIAFAVICMRTGTVWPWSRVVHEDGVRTLVGTILYFEHATRELPLDILLGMAIGGSVFFAFPASRAAPPGGDTRRRAVLAAATLIIVAIIVGGAAIVAGPASALENLLQHHTRPGAELLWGSHWRYHLLSRLALILAVLGFAGVLRIVRDGGIGGSGNLGLVAVAGTLGVYLVLTLVFADGTASMLQPFRDPQYLGHQARELFTHALVSVPIGWGACVLLLRRHGLTAAQTAIPGPKRVAPAVVIALGMGALGVLLGGFVGFAALHADAASLGQTKDLAMLVFPHFFEHSFTYLLVPVVAALTYELVAGLAVPTASRGAYGPGT